MDQDLSKNTTIPCLEASQTVDSIKLDGFRTFHELTEINGNENVKEHWRKNFPLPTPSASLFFSQHLCEKDTDQQLIDQEGVINQITDIDEEKKLLSCQSIKNNVNSEHDVTDIAIDTSKTTQKGFNYVQIYTDGTITHTQDNQSAAPISDIQQKSAVPITTADGFNKSVTVDSAATDPLLIITGNHNKSLLLKEESEDNISGNQSSQFNPSSINFSESDTDAEVESAKVLFYIFKDRDDISTLHEVESLQTEAEDTVENKTGKSNSSEDILVTQPESNCETNNFINCDDLGVNYDSSVAGFTGTNDHFQSESLDVNFDSESVESLTDLEDDHICSQYSNPYSIDDVEPKPDYSGVPDNQTIVRESRSDRSGLNNNDLNEQDIDKAEFKIHRNTHAQSLAKDSTVSDISAFESFYSLDACSTPVVRRLKKTLTWTPRILSEERFLSSRSTTLSSDVTSFYTAETSGTFYSARSFQLDSCDNFVTCEDFQALQLHIEPKSKLRRAKDALLRGREFFRSKFECYIKKLPHSPRHSDKKSKKLCHNSCGFSCIHVGKEISMYSLPDLQSESKGGNKNEIELKGENCDGMDIGGDCLNTHKENKQKLDGLSLKRLVHNEGMDSREKNNGHSENDSLVNRKRGDLIVDDHDVCLEENELGQKADEKQDRGVKKHKSKNDRKQRMPTLSRGTTEDTEDDLPVGTEAYTVSQGRPTRESYDSDESRSKKRLRWVSAVEKSQGSSLTSAHTSSSSVDQLLFQREMDPELLLSSLGFGGTVQTDDDTLSRIPDRFLLSAHSPQSVDGYQPVMNPPETHHLLPVMGTSQLMQGISHSMHNGHSPGVQCTSPVSPEDSPVFADDNVDGIDFRPGNQNKSSSKEKGQFSNSNLYIANENNNPIKDKDKNSHDQEKSLNKNRILELCGIVPERYLIKSKQELAESIKNRDIKREPETAETEQLLANTTEHKGANLENDEGCTKASESQGTSPNQFDTGVSRAGKDKVVVEVEVHDRYVRPSDDPRDISCRELSNIEENDNETEDKYADEDEDDDDIYY